MNSVHSPGLRGQIPLFATPGRRDGPATSGPSAWDFFAPTAGQESDPSLIPKSLPARVLPPDSIRVIENEWCVGRWDTSYRISTGGCGAVKIFLNGDSSRDCIVFHSFGDEEARTAARAIGNYILHRQERPHSLSVLCLQPYAISQDVMNSVHEIGRITEGAGIPTEVRAVCLNNIEHEDYSEFIQLDLAGSEQQILERHAELMLQDRALSKPDRARKIELFQSLPARHRTPEFLKKWSGLSLDEARLLVEEMRAADETWIQRLLSRIPFLGED